MVVKILTLHLHHAVYYTLYHYLIAGNLIKQETAPNLWKVYFVKFWVLRLNTLKEGYLKTIEQNVYKAGYHFNNYVHQKMEAAERVKKQDLEELKERIARPASLDPGVNIKQ